MAAAPVEPSARPSRFESACRALSFIVPAAAGVWQATPSVDFQDDVALLRAFGSIPVGLEGLVSAALGGAFGLLPLGDRVLRASYVSALGLGLSGFLLYHLALALLRARKGERRSNVLFALAAALIPLLGPSFALEGSRPGGAAVAVALGLATLAAKGAFGERGPGAALATGALLGATALESRGTAGAVLLALGVEGWLSRAWPSRRTTLFGALGALSVLTVPLALAVALVVSAAPNAALALGSLGRGLGVDASAVDRSAALGAWLAEVGLVGSALSLLGLGAGLCAAAVRPRLAAWAVFVALDLCLGAARTPPTESSSLLAVHLLALGALALGAALGMRALLDALERAKIPFAAGANALLLVYTFSLVFVSQENGTRATETRATRAAAAFTEAALDELPAGSALLVRSEALLFRVQAARVVGGARPDLLIVPIEQLESEKVYAELVAREPSLIPLVREVLLAGRPSEYALSALADARPTFLELGPDTNERLHGHLVPRAFFTEFTAHPLARSDRKLGTARGEAGFRRVFSAVQRSPDGDPATRALLVDELGARSLLLAGLGDRDIAAEVVADLLALAPESSLGLGLTQRLRVGGKGRVDVSGLYAAR